MASILISLEAGVQTITLNRPETLNAFTPEMHGMKIVSANSVSMAAAVREAGGDPVDLGIAQDDPASLRNKLEATSDADLVVTTAGFSVGDHDHVRGEFASLGGHLDFWNV